MADQRTKSVHTGVYKDKTYNSVTTPIYPTSTFAFEKIGKTKAGYDYTRSGNPTRTALEENLADLEGGTGCSVTSTGMSAVLSACFFLKPGDHILTGNDIYGGTYRLFDQVLKPWGIEFSFIDMYKTDEVKKAFKKNTKMVWIETPSNPLLNIVDIAACAKLARDHKALSVVDNTFLSPYFQKPLDLGVDIVVHSTTKYINGHSDVVGGAVIYGSSVLEERGRFLVNALGVSQAPYDAWLVLRGVKTLAQRMEAHQENAFAVARFLKDHPHIKKVYFTGLDHPQSDLIARQMTGHGGMLAFELNTKRVPLDKFFKSLKYFSLAESLGGVESLIEHPWSMSHAGMGEKALKASGMTTETIRVSCGIESPNDLVADLKKALK